MISYSAITNTGSVTLPSVESWGNNMNILRDPPKSIMTRRIDKVGDTSSITTMVANSEDRLCEAINVYPRGINPCVSVSYSNYGNNGGQRNGMTRMDSHQQAKLPRTILKDGAFRPPIKTQAEYLPLSRQPRVWTTAFSKPGFIDFSRKKRDCLPASKVKEVKTETFNILVAPTATYNIKKPFSEPFEVKYVIQPAIKVSATSGRKTQDITQQFVQKFTKGTEENLLHARAQTKTIRPSLQINKKEMYTDNYTQEPIHYDANVNVSSKNNHTDISNILDLSNIRVQNIPNINYIPNKSANDPNHIINPEKELSRLLPKYNLRANNINNTTKYFSIPKINEISLTRNIPPNNYTSKISARRNNRDNREIKISKKINYGSFVGKAQVPYIKPNKQNLSLKHDAKTKNARNASILMKNRFNNRN